MELERVAAHYSRSRGLAIAINVEPEVEQMMEPAMKELAGPFLCARHLAPKITAAKSVTEV